MQILQYYNNSNTRIISIVYLSKGLNIGSKVVLRYSFDEVMINNKPYYFDVKFTLVAPHTWQSENSQIYTVDNEFYDTGYSVHDLVLMYLGKLTVEKILE